MSKSWREATDLQLRRAAAVLVMGWKAGGWPPGFVSDQDAVLFDGNWTWSVTPDGEVDEILSLDHDWEGEGFFPESCRDDLARVFVAASEHPNGGKGSLFEEYEETIWGTAITDPRSALVRLLELCCPEGMNDE